MKTTLIDSMSLAHHLGVVAEHYEERAEQLRGFVKEMEVKAETRADAFQAKELTNQAEGHRRLAEQFNRQAKECREWCEALYNQDTLRVDGDRFVVKHSEAEAA